jgi:homoserine kinase
MACHISMRQPLPLKWWGCLIEIFLPVNMPVNMPEYPSGVIVSVPATTANLGPGFDCLGAALSLENQFRFIPTDGHNGNPEIVVTGAEAVRVKSTSQNLAYQAFTHLYHHTQQQPPAIRLEIQLGVPLARGLGSSATAIVGGLVGANALAGSPLSPSQVLDLAIGLEGHPDNVAPALLGGCRLAATGRDGQTWSICPIPWSESVVPVVAIPDFELSTKAARQVLPGNCTYADAIFNIGHLGLLLQGLAIGNGNWLQAALQDRLHQPYRQSLITGYAAVDAAAIEAGAYGMVISGAGPTLLALANVDTVPAVVKAMQTAWSMLGITAQVSALSLNQEGTRVNSL